MQVLLNIILSTSILLIVSFSFSLIYYSTKFFHFAHAAIIAIGSYFTYLFTNQFSFLIAAIIAIVLATIIGIFFELFVYRSMRKKKLHSLAYLISSIGLYIILQNCISLYFGDDTKVIRKGGVTIGHEIFGGYVTTVQIVSICISITLFVSVYLFLKYSSVGKSIRAVSSNSELCNIYGINSNKIILIAFAIGSALAAIAGILSAMDTNMIPTFGFNLLLYGVVAMIIGGVGSTKGLIGGALLVAVAQNLAGYYIDTKWMDAITYIILIAFLIYKPLGFSGNRLKKVEV